MNIFVTGVAGQLGHDVVEELTRRGIPCVGSDLSPDAPSDRPYIPLDITDGDAVRRTLEAVRPDAVIHCAAWTAVDLAEDEPARVHAVNAEGTAHIATACKLMGAKLMYISTDYVFDGQGETPWKPDCTEFAPLNVYGQSKLDGELAVRQLLEQFFIVRIAWVFGLHGKNFVKTMLQLGQKHPELRVVCDQIGTPTYTPDLARLLADMIVTERYGVYHATNEGEYISWYDFACEILRQAGSKAIVHPVTTAEYGLSKAARPFNSRLDRSKLADKGFTPLPHWQDALQRYLEALKDA